MQSQLLDPVPGQILDGIAFPGANGVAVFRGSLYVSNSAQENILSIPLTRDGSPDPSRAAHALHQAIRTLRQEDRTNNPLRWAPYIHLSN